MTPPSLKHIYKLTTPKGLYQHSRFSEPDKKFGYSIDDNARMLIACFQYYEIYGDAKVLDLAKIYLRYIERAQMPSGFFHNFASSNGNFIDLCGSQDSQGRTIWALGYVASKPEISKELSKKALVILDNFRFDLRSIKYERAKAFSMLGYYFVGDKKKVKKIADTLVKDYMEHETESWQWFEDHLTYSNAIMPYAMMLAYKLTGDKVYKKIGLRSLKFLHNKCLFEGVPAPIGQNGWYLKRRKKAIYDQQVVDAADMVLAHALAFKLTKEEEYAEAAELWWGWFSGNNIQKRSLIDEKTDGIFDGLTDGGVNLNQGAESIVCYILAYLVMVKLEQDREKLVQAR